MSTPMLSAQGVDCYYGSSRALRDVSLEVPGGACTALLGRNGVGKTTLLKCLMGVLPVARGTVTFCGQDITHLPPHARVKLGMAYVPQGRDIFPRLSVEENLRMGMASLPAREAKAVPESIYGLFPVLARMRHRRGGDLSGGQQQQLAIGRALASRPRLLILDEPTEGIQPSIILEIERVIRELAQRGDMAILLVEQYYEFARGLADHYAVMSRGEVVRRGRGAQMEEENVHSYLAL
jgi:urea transport system ATP-binding protein